MFLPLPCQYWRVTEVTCHDDSGSAFAASDSTAPGALALAPERTVLLVGRPNVGKSTLFNLLTGAHQKTMNVPRTTVSIEVGTWNISDDSRTRITDLPGTYSLIPQSPDEEVTANAVADLAAAPGPGDVVIVVLDATALASSLYLFAQAKQSGLPVIAALTMNDLADSASASVDAVALSRAIGAPVVSINPRRGVGASDLAAAVLAFDGTAFDGTAFDDTVVDRTAFDGAVVDRTSTGRTAFQRGAIALPGLPSTESSLPLYTDPDPETDPDTAAEAELARAHELFAWVREVLAAIGASTEPRATPSDKLDAALLRPIVGIPVFLAILWATFQLTTTISGPIQDWFEGLITGPVTGWFSTFLGALHAPSWLESLTVNGLLAGVGTVVSFLPLMVIIFTMIFILEDSGYLARVAVMADRAMQSIGLDGRAVLPLVIGFGCNIPALSATKTIPDSRQRLLTGLLVPYSSCTARLVIYLLLASVFFPGHAGTVVFSMYVVSVVVIVGVAFALRKTVFRGVIREPLVIVLPAYQAPRFGALARAVALRCSGFAKRAGVVILGLSMAVWVLMAVPIDGKHAFGDTEMPVQSSLFGAAADGLSPVFAPAGFADWHVTASLITGFVAKEAVVGTLATTYGLDEPSDPSLAGDLSGRLRETFTESSGGQPGLAAIAFMVFCLAYTPCLVTVAEQKRLFGGKITAASVSGSIILAWVLAVAIFQIGGLFV